MKNEKPLRPHWWLLTRPADAFPVTRRVIEQAVLAEYENVAAQTDAVPSIKTVR